MNRREFIDSGEVFYHITPTRNVPGILRDGLRNGNGNGICVVRSNNLNVIRYLVETMLIGDGDREFTIIRIAPQAHNIAPEEILNDGVVELTNPIHNYIVRNNIPVVDADLIDTYTHPSLGIFDLTPIEILIRNEVDLTPLTL